EMALAVRRAESSRGERKVWLGQTQPHAPLAVELFQRDAGYEGMRGIEQRPNHVVFRFAEAGVVEAHARGQKTEDLDIRFLLTGRGERGPRKLQIVMAVSRIQVRVLQESGNR